MRDFLKLIKTKLFKIKLTKFTTVVLIAVIFIFVSSGVLAWSNRISANSDSALASVQQIRDETMLYIAANHTETAPLTTNLTWSGGKVDEGVLASETYRYTSGNWQLEISFPAVQSPLYSICANYTSDEVTVVWKGTYEEGILTEVSSDVVVNNSGLTQPQIRDLAMNYIKTFHNQTTPYMQSLTWTGGKATPPGMLGSETYSYQSNGWNVTIQYPVVPDPVYNITIQYTAIAPSTVMINWQGTLQEGIIIETSYTYTP
jgi:hypothetical protein